ncbi:MAG: tRNA lysidine(34) synthetase TilS, partial [Synergistaceae bacterium]|nr:tRNA lysidine(34) synthetase TilS [Synergistaceae bacterium]
PPLQGGKPARAGGGSTLPKEIPFELSDYALRKYFRETGERQGWLPEKEAAVLLSVSGGGDSVALLWLFRKFYAGKIIVAHVNHGIRGNESDLDEEFSAKISASLDVPFAAEKINVPSMMQRGESLESAARRLRREALAEIAEKFGVDCVFLGHNRDDLAETVLFNILRGTGIRGAVGMTEWTDYSGVKFYRPLLGLRRDFLRSILRSRGLSWREDSSNTDTTYTRNFIRLEVLPMIEHKINSSAVEHLAAFAEDMRKVRASEDKQARDLLEMCQESDSPSLVLSREILRRFDDDERMLTIREAGRVLGLKTLSRGRCQELAGLIVKPSAFIFQWCKDMTVKAKNGKIMFERSVNHNAD